MHVSTAVQSLAAGLHLIFHRHHTRYAVPLPSVKEVIPLPQLIIIDSMPDHVVGVCRYRGQLVPVLNLDGLLGHVTVRYKISDNILLFQWDGFVCGLIIDDVQELLDIRPEELDLESPPEIEPGGHQPLIAHRLEREDGVINVLHSLPLPQERQPLELFLQTLAERNKEGVLEEAPPLIRGMTLLEQSILQERTSSLMECEKEDLSEHVQLVVMRIGQEYFGVDLSFIRECAELQGVTPIPGCPAFVLGVINLRGEVLPIVDLRDPLSVPKSGNEPFPKAVVVQFENIFVGLAANEILESVSLSANDMVSGSLTENPKEQGYVRGLAQFDDQKILKVLDLRKLAMNGEITVDQTFSPSAGEQSQEVSEQSGDPASHEEHAMTALFIREGKESLSDLSDTILKFRDRLNATEKAPENIWKAELQKAFDQSHFLMSVARMFGNWKMEMVARRVEDVLCRAKKEPQILTPELVAHVDHCLQSLQVFLDACLTGTATDTAPLALLEKDVFEDVELVPSNQPVHLEPEVNSGSREEPLIVDPIRLEALLSLCHDLKAVLGGRHECLGDATHLVKFADSWSQDVFGFRRFGTRGNRSPGPAIRNVMASFYQQESQHLTHLTSMVGRVARAVHDEHQRLTAITGAIEEQVLSMRLRSFSSFFQWLPKMALDMARQFKKEIELGIEGGHITVDLEALEDLKEPVRQLIRNAIEHGVEPPNERIQVGKPPKGALRLYAFKIGTHLILELWDDGKGLDIEAIKQAAVRRHLFPREEVESMPSPQVESLVFHPGLSTTSSPRGGDHRGMGLTAVQSAVKRLKGAVYVGSTPGSGCMIQIQLPGPTPSQHLLIVAVGGQKYGLPIEQVKTTTYLQANHSPESMNQEFVNEDGQTVPLMPLGKVLETADWNLQAPLSSCVFVAVEDQLVGFLVDDILAEQEVKPQPQGFILKKVRHVAGTTILNTGEICVIVNAVDLMRSAQKQLAGSCDSSSW